MSAGIKHDQGKPPMSLLPMGALKEVAKVMDFGAKKYGRHNYKNGMDWSRLLDANLRHLSSFIEGEDLDPETQLSHIAHATCCSLFLLEYILSNTGKDDRFKPTEMGKALYFEGSLHDVFHHNPKP